MSILMDPLVTDLKIKLRPRLTKFNDAVTQLRSANPGIFGADIVKIDNFYRKSTEGNMLHDFLKPLSWLAGRWRTEAGEGKYPTINSFIYNDELEFNCIGQPMFNYVSKSSHPTKKTPMHQERGFLRIKPNTNEISLILSHNFGLTSIENGHFDEQEKVLMLKTVSIERISFAKDPKVKGFERTIRLMSPDTIEVVVLMETENTPMTEHLRAVYKKVE